MGKIGSFGGVGFEVSNKKALTFEGFSRSGSSRWSVHEVSNHKPIPEFIGPDQEEVSFSIKLSAFHGVNPEKEIGKLKTFRDKGKVGSFVLGTKPISNSYWYIENLTEGNIKVDGKGRILLIEAEITLKEYPRKATAKKTKKVISSKKKTNNVSKRKGIGKIKIKASFLNIRSSPSLQGKILKTAKKNESYTVYTTKTTDITWYDLGAGRWISANTTYVSFEKG